MEFIVRDDGLLADKAVKELASWYSGESGDEMTFEAHLMMLKAYGSLVTSAQRGRRTNLSLERYSLLRVLYMAPEQRMLMSEMSRALNVSPTSITKLVNALTAARLVRRADFAGDKRRTWAEITPEGMKVVRDNLPAARHFTLARWRGLTDEEKRVLVHLLSKLVLSAQSAGADQRLRGLESEAASAIAGRG